MTIELAYRTSVVRNRTQPLLTSTLNVALIAICVAAATGGVWAVFQMLQRARAFGGRFWSSNPVALFAGVTMRHAAIFFVCWIFFVAAFVSLIVLNHGLDELTKLLATIRAGAPKH